MKSLKGMAMPVWFATFVACACVEREDNSSVAYYKPEVCAAQAMAEDTSTVCPGSSGRLRWRSVILFYKMADSGRDTELKK